MGLLKGPSPLLIAAAIDAYLQVDTVMMNNVVQVIYNCIINDIIVYKGV